jgi:transcriptional regulator with XRE-family HTH domain
MGKRPEMPDQQIELGRRLRIARLERQASVNDLSVYLKCTPQTIYNWEKGWHAPSVWQLYMLSLLLREPLVNFLDTRLRTAWSRRDVPIMTKKALLHRDTKRYTKVMLTLMDLGEKLKDSPFFNQDYDGTTRILEKLEEIKYDASQKEDTQRTGGEPGNEPGSELLPVCAESAG